MCFNVIIYTLSHILLWSSQVEIISQLYTCANYRSKTETVLGFLPAALLLNVYGHVTDVVTSVPGGRC